MGTLEPLAIVGIGCRLPGAANTPDEFWRLLREGRDAVSEIPENRFDIEAVFDSDPATPGTLYTKSGGIIDAIDMFDAAFFGISPREAGRIDPQHRLLLETAWEGLEDAGIVPARLAGTASGVFVGISGHDYGDMQARPENRVFIDAHSNSGGAACIAANRISYLLDLRGPSMAVDTACSAALTAVHLACCSIWRGESSLALAAGVNALIAPEPTIGFAKASMLAPDGRCKAFDARADGYVRSEGAGVVVLKPLSDALEAGDRIYALIRATAINQDGHTSGMSVPGADSQAQMLRDAVRRAEVDPLRFEYVEAHGTGTRVGDPVEARAIGAALARGRPEHAPLRIGSVKTNVGHLESAAGIVGLIKASLVLERREIPPTLHFQQPNPEIPFEDLRLRVVTAVEPLEGRGEPALAAVNAFGFGGANATVILEEWRPELPAGPDRAAPRPELLTLSAKSPESLREQARRYGELLASNPELADVCYSAARRRTHFEHRAAFVADSGPALAAAVRSFADGEEAGAAVGEARRGREPRIAFVFPGMGAQWWAMGRELVAHEPVFRSKLEECDSLLEPLSGFSLLEELAADEDASNVGQPFFDHVSNLAIQVGLATVLGSWGIVPAAVVGHSSGELAAAHVAGALDLASVLELALHRGRLQQRALGSGKMLAAGIAPEAAEELIASRGVQEGVSIAAVNSPTSVTLSGSAEALEQIERDLTERQLFARFLSVAVPYHSAYMDPLRKDFFAALGDIDPRDAEIPFVSAMAGGPSDGRALDADYWWRNLREPVLFSPAIAWLGEEGYDAFVEVGPHPVLAASIRECLSQAGVEPLVLRTLRRGESEREGMLRMLAELHVRGQGVQWPNVYPTGAFVSLPTYPWQRERHWLEAGADGAAAARSGKDTGRPLLGRRLRAPHPCWEIDLGHPRLAYLGDHVVGQRVVFPGAAYVETVLSAAEDLAAGQPPALERIRFHKLLALDWPLERTVATSTLHVSHAPADRRLEVHANQDGDWTLHASARLTEPDRVTAPRLDLLSIERRCTGHLASGDLRRSLDDAGYHFGRRFQRLSEMRLGAGEALARVDLPGDLADDGYCAHPLLVDAAFQLVGIAAGLIGSSEAHPAFPVSIGRLRYWRRPAGPLWAYASVRTTDGGPRLGDAFLLDDEGNVLLECEELELQTLLEPGAAPADGLADWLYEIGWRDSPLPERSAGRPVALAAPDEIPPSLEPTLDELVETWRRADYYETVEPGLDALAAAWAGAALAALGHTGAGAGGAALGVVAGHRDLFRRLIEIAATDQSDGLELAATGRVTSVADAAATTAAFAREHPEYAHEAELIRLCGTQLAGILRGEVDARQMFFGGEALEALSGFYHDSPTTRFYNAVVAEGVAALAGGAPARSLHVVEVGAGTGATTAAVLPALGERIARYTFTDVSPFFLRRAEERFGDAGVEFATFDVEGAPEAQGFDSQADLVLAAYVLHTATDVRGALENIRRILAPGGVLVLSEPTRRAAWLDVIFGVFEGWWRFSDRDLRRSHALLHADAWQRVLHESGFDSATLSDPHRAGGTLGAVVLARRRRVSDRRRPAPQAPGGRSWLVLADRRGVAERIGAKLSRRGARVELVHSSADGLRVPSRTAPERPDGVIHAWSLDAPAAGDALSTDELMDWQQTLCGSALALAERIGPSTEIAFLTAGAQVVPGDARSPDVVQSPLWGLARVMMTEYAAARCRIIDIAPEAGEGDLEAVVRELGTADGEREVVLRGAKRFVREVDRCAVAERHDDRARRAQRSATDWFGLAVESPGVLDSLHVGDMPELRPGPGELCIRVAASGLNFRSVLLALDMLPVIAAGAVDISRELGMEHAGEVVAIGDGVEGFEFGDEVVALAPGAIGSHVIARASLTAHKPSVLDWATAASVPGAFLTAEYTLGHLARLRPGERVLIHSAAGGVGLAAVGFAQRAGAEVLATAGTPEKRDVLRSLGVRHVMDSHSLAWAREVRDLDGVDVILNSLGGEAIRKGLEVLRRHGRFVEIGVRDILQDSAVGLLPFRKNLSLFAIDLIEVGTDHPDVIRALLRDVLRRLAAGETHALPLTTFDLADAEDAFRLMAQARHVGKIVLTLERPEYSVRVSGRAPLFRADGTYLVTGGLGGFALKVAEWMARAGAGTLVLVSRSGVPQDEQGLRAVQQTGANLVVLRGDVGCEEDVRRVLGYLEEHCPPLRGVFHAAMVLDDDLLVRLDASRLARVLAPKIAGAWNLHRLTAGIELDHFVLFSSVASLWGHQAQGSYSAANAFLDALAPYRRSLGLPCSCVNWGPITGAGYVARHAEVGEYLAWSGQRGLAPDEAVSALEAVLRRNLVNVMVARIDWASWSQQARGIAASRPFVRFAHRYGAGEAQAARDLGALSLLRATPPAERAAVMEEVVVKRVAKISGAPPASIDREKALTELGFDSLMGVELQTALKLDFGIPISIVELLQGMSVREVVAALGEQLTLDGGGMPAPAEAPAEGEPLSSEQRRFWFLDRLQPGTAACNLYMAYRVAGRLDVEAVRAVVDEWIGRHDMLRARFSTVDGEPRQIIAPAGGAPLALVDLSGVTPAEREARMVRLLSEEVQRPFDLTEGPLLRAMLLRLGEREHVLCATVHHIAFDARSANILMAEGLAIYDAQRRGNSVELPSPGSYQDYVRRQQQMLADASAQEEHLDYWRRQLAGVEPLTLAARAPAKHSVRGEHVHFALDRATTGRLGELSTAEGAPIFTTLMAVFQMLVRIYSGRDDFVVGSPVITRGFPGADSTVGCFINTLALRADLSGDPPFVELVRRVRRITSEALAHQEVPFERVVEEMRPAREADSTPLVQTMLVVHTAGSAEIQLPGLSFEPVAVESGTALFDLLLLIETGPELRCSLEYSADVFDRSTAEQIARHFRALVERVLDRPELPISQHSPLSAADRCLTLRTWNDTRVDFPDLHVDELFERQAAASPDAPAIAGGGSRLSFAELDARSTAVAHRLLNLGVEPESIVAVCMAPSADLVATALGTLKAGGAYLPLDTLQPPGRLFSVLADARPRLVVADRASARTLSGQGVEVVEAGADWTDPSKLSGARRLRAQGDSLAYVIYTSGSTGAPNGVLVTHGALSNQVHARQHAFPLSNDDRVLQWIPLGFDPSIWELFGPLCFGATLVLGDAAPDPADVHELGRRLVEERITAFQVVPSVLQALLEQGALRESRSLRHVFCGGEPLAVEVASEFLAQSGAELHNVYGPAEATIDTTYWTCSTRPHADDPPIGLPIANAQVYLLDAGGGPVPVGAAGELYVGGAGVASGYLNRPALTAERFVPNPFDRGASPRLYRTGDRARRRPDGAIEFLGRSDNQVKIRGVRVALEEIEAAIAALPGVRATACVAHRGPSEDTTITAYVVADSNGAQPLAALRPRLAQSLPSQMLPSRVVAVHSLPLLASGKVDRMALRARATGTSPTAAIVPARDDVELELVEIWENCLGCRPISVTADFFDLGGHSLLAARVVSQIQERSGHEISLRDLFERPTVEKLAELLRPTAVSSGARQSTA